MLLGAFARLTALIHIDSVAGAIRDGFAEKIASANIAAARAAYDSVSAAGAVAA